MEDKRIIMLKKRSSMTFKEQCSTYKDFIRIDVTSCNKNMNFVREISPLYIGPVISSDGLTATTFENLWQYGKVYPRIYDENKKIVPGVDEFGNPTEEFYKWRKRFYLLKKEKGDRHPALPSMIRHRDCLYMVYFDKDGNLKKLDYVTSRKRIYIPEYAKLIVNTDSFKEIKKLYDSGAKIALCDFDAWNYYGTNLDQDTTIVDIVNNPQYKVGHGYVIKMLLQGDIEVVNDEIIDHVGVLK